MEVHRVTVQVHSAIPGRFIYEFSATARRFPATQENVCEHGVRIVDSFQAHGTDVFWWFNVSELNHSITLTVESQPTPQWFRRVENILIKHISEPYSWSAMPAQGEEETDEGGWGPRLWSLNPGSSWGVGWWPVEVDDDIDDSDDNDDNGDNDDNDDNDDSDENDGDTGDSDDNSDNNGFNCNSGNASYEGHDISDTCNCEGRNIHEHYTHAAYGAAGGGQIILPDAADDDDDDFFFEQESGAEVDQLVSSDDENETVYGAVEEVYSESDNETLKGEEETIDDTNARRTATTLPRGVAPNFYDPATDLVLPKISRNIGSVDGAPTFYDPHPSAASAGWGNNQPKRGSHRRRGASAVPYPHAT